MESNRKPLSDLRSDRGIHPAKIRYRVAWAFLATVLAVCSAERVRSHDPIYGVGTVTQVTVQEDHLLLVFDLSYNGTWAHAEMLSMDRNRDSIIDAGEATEYMEMQWEMKGAFGLRCRINGKEVRLRPISSKHEGLVGSIDPHPFSLYYELEARHPQGDFPLAEKQEIEIEDLVLQGESPGKPFFMIPYTGHSQERGLRFAQRVLSPKASLLGAEGYTVWGEKLVMEFEFTQPTSAGVPGRVRPQESLGRRTAVNENHDEVGTLTNAFDAGLGGVVGLLLLAMVYGAGHAFTPGHGKSMVAAYLIGTKGRVRDAVILGLTVTFTHTITVYVIGVILLGVANLSTRSEGNLRNMAIVACSLVSGVFLVVFGLVLFFRRYRRLQLGLAPIETHSHEHGHSHSHHHGHEYSHAHHHDEPGTREPEEAHDHGHSHGEGRRQDHSHATDGGQRPHLGELLALGFSGGILPCPAGLMVIGIGLQYPDKFLLAFLFLLFFSFGLGTILVAIGIVLVTGKSLAGEKLEVGRFLQSMKWPRKLFAPSFLASLDRRGVEFLRVMPAFSCLIIVALGSYFAVTSAIRGHVEIAALIEAAESWLGI